MAQAGASGAGYGFLSGLGGSYEEDAMDVLKEAGKSALISGGLGVTTQPVMGMIGAGGRQVMARMSPTSAGTYAQQKVAEALIRDVPEPLTGANALTRAQARLLNLGPEARIADVGGKSTRNLLDVLASDEYDPPPEDLQGLTTIQNTILVGFVGNTVYFSEPGQPSAFPARYATPVGDEIVALAALAGSLLVLTKGYPYLIAVRDPAAGVSVDRIDVLYPCLSATSVVTMGYGIVWSTNDGLAVYSPSSGAALVTKALYNNDTWTVDVNPNTVVAEYYGENYFASHSTGSFVFEQDTKGGFFVDTDPVFTASWYDTQTGKLYYVSGTLGDIYEWDDLSQPALTVEWKSKVIVTKDMLNLGAARVVADYSAVTATWDTDVQIWNAALTNWDLADEITFRLWVDKQLIFTTTVNDVNGFRLPTGYRTDTFEVGVEGNVRVRAIHLAETMLGLREV
jgi:hypothetical protein